MLDLVTTKIALATAGVRELNPFYHLFPFAEHFKIFAPLILFSLYVLLYIFSGTEEGKKGDRREQFAMLNGFIIPIFHYLHQ